MSYVVCSTTFDFHIPHSFLILQFILNSEREQQPARIHEPNRVALWRSTPPSLVTSPSILPGLRIPLTLKITPTLRECELSPCSSTTLLKT